MKSIELRIDGTWLDLKSPERKTCFHLGVSTSDFFPFYRTTLPYFNWIAEPRNKVGYCRWNFVAILFTNRDTRIWSLKAAILDFPLPVFSRLVVNITIFQLDSLTRKQRYSRRNFVAILFTNRDLRIWSLEVPSWIFHFRCLPVWSWDIAIILVG